MTFIKVLEQIGSLIGDPNTTLEQVLRVDYVVQFYNEGVNSGLNQYLFCKSEELLNISLISPDVTLRNRAYEIICGDNTDIIKNLISKQLISKAAETFLFDDNTDHLIISRLINVFERCFGVDFTQSSSQFYFITEFTRFLDDQNVIGFFTDCSNHPYFGKKFVEWLNDLQFDERLIDKLQEETNKKVKNADFLNGLFIIIDNFIQKKEAISRFLTPSKLEIIIRQCPREVPKYVEYSHAKMILDITNEFSVQFIASQVNSFASVVFNNENVNLSDSCESSKEEIEKNLNGVDQINEQYLLFYQILIKIFSLCKTENYFSLSVLLDVAFFILNQFQSHTFALLVVSDFLILCTKYETPLRDQTISRFVEFAKKNLENNLNLNLIGIIYKVMTEMQDKADWTNFDKSDFSALFDKFIVPKKEIIDAEYGGSAPSQQPSVFI